MKKSETKDFLIYCLIIVGFLLFLFANQCSTKKESKKDLQTKPVLVSTKVIPGDPAPVEVKRAEKAPKPVIVIFHDTIPGKIDTAEVFKYFYAKYFYIDSIWSNDSSILAIIQDSIYQNRIISRKPYLQNLRKTAIINNYTTEQEQARKFYVGPVFGLGFDRRFAAGLSLMYISKSERPFTYSYDAVNKMHLGSVYFKLK
jgi:hypothetical protein